MQRDERTQAFPRIDPLGLDSVLIRFADSLSEPANRAALAFRQAVIELDLLGVRETASSLVSVQIRFDPRQTDQSQIAEALKGLMAGRDWLQALLPTSRRLWKIPAVYGGEHGPQLALAAEKVGISQTDAIEQLSTFRFRALAIGFAPGQPYLGQLPEKWNLPRQTDLQTRVPTSALALAVRQFVLFSAETQTGWYHIGQTAFRCFRPDGAVAFPLQPGDELVFPSISEDVLDGLRGDPTGDGGATCEVLP